MEREGGKSMALGLHSPEFEAGIFHLIGCVTLGKLLATSEPVSSFVKQE